MFLTDCGSAATGLLLAGIDFPDVRKQHHASVASKRQHSDPAMRFFNRVFFQEQPRSCE